MPDHQRVSVYIKAKQARILRQLGFDVGAWVRAQVDEGYKSLGRDVEGKGTGDATPPSRPKRSGAGSSQPVGGLPPAPDSSAGEDSLSHFKPDFKKSPKK